ncbi:hypothetical protein SAMN05444422_101605 [Halobiforma haloterrestris]|uniref:Uncharacterized protein n=1 Tax=Natronobacterium haloterrestre TaxID=148448 RepID=A0A1I1DHC5_NATHA|nr:hypothetical protein SAMN05444422_101605 [Halobiforma haloterrestris]
MGVTTDIGSTSFRERVLTQTDACPETGAGDEEEDCYDGFGERGEEVIDVRGFEPRFSTADGFRTRNVPPPRSRFPLT